MQMLKILSTLGEYIRGNVFVAQEISNKENLLLIHCIIFNEIYALKNT